MSTVLAVLPNRSLTIQETLSVGGMLAKSGFFADARQEAQAVAKILAGQELGFPPVASMNGIYIINGRIAIAANLIAAAVKRSGKYNYIVREMSDKACSIEFFEDKQPIGISSFTYEDARKAQTKNLDKFPRNMLFARALTNGARWFTPDVFNGPIYTPDELGASTNEEGEVIDVQASYEPQPEPEHTAAPPSDPRANLLAELKAKVTEARAAGILVQQIVPAKLTNDDITAKIAELHALMSPDA